MSTGSDVFPEPDQRGSSLDRQGSAVVALPPSFRWTKAPWGAALTCLPLRGTARHFFSTRQLSLGNAAGSSGAWSAVASLAGVHAEAIVRVSQVHGAAAVVIRRGTAVAYDTAPPVGDAILTDDPSRAVAVHAADCVPLLLVDPGARTVAAVHAGWRGIAARAPAAAVRRMQEVFGTDPSRLIAAVGPSIGACCYSVGGDVRATFGALGHDEREIDAWFREESGALRLDLWRATRDQLASAGVPHRSIHVCGLCTAHHLDLFYSYRVEGPRAGRLVAVIRPLAPGGRQSAQQR